MSLSLDLKGSGFSRMTRHSNGLPMAETNLFLRRQTNARRCGKERPPESSGKSARVDCCASSPSVKSSSRSSKTSSVSWMKSSRSSPWLKSVMGSSLTFKVCHRRMF